MVLTLDELGALFKDYLQLLGYKFYEKLPWTHMDAYSLEINLPGNINQKGTALFINETQRYDVIYGNVPKLIEYSDFMFVFSPGSSDVIIKYFERSIIKYNDSNNKLFPSTQILTRKDLSNIILEQAIKNINSNTKLQTS